MSVSLHKVNQSLLYKNNNTVSLALPFDVSLVAILNGHAIGKGDNSK